MQPGARARTSQKTRCLEHQTRSRCELPAWPHIGTMTSQRTALHTCRRRAVLQVAAASREIQAKNGEKNLHACRVFSTSDSVGAGAGNVFRTARRHVENIAGGA